MFSQHLLRRMKYWRVRVPLWMTILVSVAIGLGAGIAIMVQRQASQDLVVAVRGSRITAHDFYHRLEIEAGPSVLRKMVDEELTLQYARRLGVYPTDKVVKDRLHEIEESRDINHYLTQTHQTAEDLNHSVRVKLSQTALFEKNVTITDADVATYYHDETNPANPNARFYAPETATISLILTRTKEAGDQALAEIKKGLPFAAVAKKYSQDYSAPSGGEVPPIHRGRMRGRSIPGLEQAIFALDPGEQFGPRLFNGAWWIVRCRDKSPAITQSFDRVKELCREGARVRKGVSRNAARIQADFLKYRHDSPVQVFWDKYLYDVTQSDRRAAGSP